jgi:hypothetical protein
VKDLLTFVQRRWHGQPLTKGRRVEKQFLTRTGDSHSLSAAEPELDAMKATTAPARRGLLAGGNWIIDQVKIIDRVALILDIFALDNEARPASAGENYAR